MATDDIKMPVVPGGASTDGRQEAGSFVERFAKSLYMLRCSITTD